MISAFGLRHDDVGPVLSAGKRQQMAEQGRRHERHVAGEHQRHREARRRERGVQAAQRAAAGHDVGDVTNLGTRDSVAANGHHVGNDALQRLQLPRENRLALHDQRAFVTPLEAGRPPADKNCRAEPGTLNLEPGTLDLEPGTLNWEPGTLYLEPGTLNLEHGTILSLYA